jgi:hypothetical protein
MLVQWCNLFNTQNLFYHTRIYTLCSVPCKCWPQNFAAATPPPTPLLWPAHVCLFYSVGARDAVTAIACISCLTRFPTMSMSCMDDIATSRVVPGSTCPLGCSSWDRVAAHRWNLLTSAVAVQLLVARLLPLGIAQGLATGMPRDTTTAVSHYVSGDPEHASCTTAHAQIN